MNNFDEMPAVRHRIKYRGENLYVVVVFTEPDETGYSSPYEIFADHATSGDYKVQYMLASWDCLTRFISLCLQNLSLAKAIDQLEKSTRQPGDLPAVILNILKKYQPKEEATNDSA